MQQNTPSNKNLDFRVFAFHRVDRPLVEAVKVDPIRSFLPIAAGVIGIALLFFTHVVRAAPALTLEKAPFEIHLKNLSYSQSVNQTWQEDLKIGQVPGTLQSSKWQAGIGNVDFNGQNFVLKNAYAKIRIEGWQYDSSMFEKGFGVKLGCSSAEASFLPGDVQIPFPASTDLVVTAQSGKLLVQANWDMNAWIVNTLKPFFSAERISQSVSVNADCTGDLGSLAQQLLRARLSDLPSKDPTFFQKTTTDLTTRAEEAVKNALSGSLAKVPAGLDVQGHLTLTTEGNGLLLKPADSTTDFLSPEARAQVRTLDSSGATAQLILSPAAMNRILLIGMTAAATSNGGSYANGDVSYRLPQQFQAKQFASFIGELSSRNPTDVILIQASLPAAVDGNPNLRPWIGSSGLGSGFDLDWTLKVQFIDAATSTIIASRQLSTHMIFNETRTASGRPTWTYAGGHWLPEKSQVGDASPELGITLDWVMNSQLLKTFLEKEITQSFNIRGVGDFSFARLGQADIRFRRADGGYYAEALVMNIQLKL